jgi:peptidase M23-like protein
VRPFLPVRPARFTTTLRALAFLPLLAGAFGCASAPLAKMSFREAGLAREDAAARPGERSAPAAPSAVAAASPAAPARSGAVPLAPALPGGALPPVTGLPADASLPPPVAVAAPEAVPSEAPEGPPIDPVLIRFAGEARGRRLAPRSTRGFPADATQAWRTLLTDLDLYLTRPLPQTPLLELVRSQVTVEAEWDYDQRRYGPPPADVAGEVAARARRLSVRIQAARALGQTMFVTRPPGKLRWPIENAGLSSGYGQRIHPMTGELQWHAGIDLATERGRVVGAAGKGYVIRAGWAGGYGMLVEVRHAGELTTRYAHLSAVLCSPGDALETGQALGLVGQTGIATGPHLHFEVWRGGLPSDPLSWLGGGSQLAGRHAGGVGGGSARRPAVPAQGTAHRPAGPAPGTAGH